MTVNFKDPVIISRDVAALVKVWHTVGGVYMLEFLTLLDYEWSVIRGSHPYRWTICLYSFTRVATLGAIISGMIGFDSSRPINCQLWATFGLAFTHSAIGAGSLLIVIRVISIWNRNRIIVVIAMSTWVANVSCLIYGIVRVRGIWLPITNICAVSNPAVTRLNTIVTLSSDVVLLLIMLVPLLCLRLEAGNWSRLSRLLWTQGLLWLLLATMGHLPQAVFILLDLNVPLDMMFGGPALITLSIAATRMYRSLIDFGSRDMSDPTESENNRMLRPSGSTRWN